MTPSKVAHFSITPYGFLITKVAATGDFTDSFSSLVLIIRIQKIILQNLRYHM